MTTSTASALYSGAKEPTPAAPRPDGARGRAVRRLILASLVFALSSDEFLTGGNFSLILQQVMVVGTLAIGQTLIILTAGIDLSVGA